MLYKSILRPLLFALEPERAHQLTFSLLKLTNYIPLLRPYLRSQYRYEEEDILCKGILTRNRIGLSAGMDKGAEVFNELADYGFGFIEVGTVTPDPAPAIRHHASSVCRRTHRSSRARASTTPGWQSSSNASATRPDG